MCVASSNCRTISYEKLILPAFQCPGYLLSVTALLYESIGSFSCVIRIILNSFALRTSCYCSAGPGPLQIVASTWTINIHEVSPAKYSPL